MIIIKKINKLFTCYYVQGCNDEINPGDNTDGEMS